jgi:hypothetical protein
MTGLTITSDWPSDHAGNGGGVVSSGILTLRDVALKGNFGSGLQVAAGSARLINVISSGNDSDLDVGIGVHVAAGATLAMTGGSIQGNGGFASRPAGLYNAGTAGLTNVNVSDHGGKTTSQESTISGRSPWSVGRSPATGLPATMALVPAAASRITATSPSPAPRSSTTLPCAGKAATTSAAGSATTAP